MAARGTWALLAAGALLAGCDDGSAGPGQEVRPLEMPTAAEREADERFAEAKALEDSGHDRQAEPVLRRVLELEPRHASALSLLSAQLLGRRRFDEAAVLAARLVEVAPQDMAARRTLFDALYGKRDFEGAEAAAREWVAKADGSSDAHYALGCALHAKGKLGLAVQELQHAASLKASRADVRSRLGLVRRAQGKLAEAEAAQRDAIQRDPRFGDAWLRLADLLALAGAPRRAEAVAAYRHAIETDPARFGFADADVYVLLRQGAGGDGASPEDVEAQWRALLASAGREMLPWGGLGAAPSDGADSAKEGRALRDAVAAHPEDAQARMKFAVHLHRHGDLAEAVDEYAEAMLGDPRNARLRASYGAAMLMKDDAATAEPQLREAVRLDPADATSWRNLGWALVQLDRDDDAIAALDQALKLAPGDQLAKRARGLARLHKGDLDAGRREIAESGWTAK